MSPQTPPAEPTPPARSAAGERVKSFLGWAFVISIILHAVTLPWFGLKARTAEKQEVEKVSVTKKIVVKPPTPPPPTPTPPPPTPPPKQTPPPIKQTAPPPQPKLKLNVVHTTSKSSSNSNEEKYVAPPKGNENGNPLGTTASGPPVAAATVAATPAPPAPSPTPKPQCAVPNADAAIKGQAVEPDYPDQAREQGAEGTVRVKVTLDASGNAVDFSVFKSSGNAALDQSAMKAARATQYTPEVVDCVKTAGSYLFDADFTAQ